MGSLSVPKNNTSAYREELSRHLFYTYCPSDKTNIQRAMKEHYLERVVYGMCGNTVVEKLVLDGETRIPWQVPRVTLEYGRIHYKADERGPMLGSQGYEGMPVSPSSLPGVNEMSRMEYEMAVDAGDSRVATEGKHLFEFCQDMELGWLEYEDRFRWYRDEKCQPS
jgi:hypothetical protein